MADVDDNVLLPGAESCQSRSSSRTSFRPSGDDLMGGEFDDDEGVETVAAARAVKSGAKQVASVGIKRTTTQVFALKHTCSSTDNSILQMGIRVIQRDVDEAVAEAASRKQRVKPFRNLKATNLPFQDTDKDPQRWDNLVHALLDWAGTLEDPFGINGRPDITDTLQTLWNAFFEDRKIVVDEYPAIRKVVRLLPK